MDRVDQRIAVRNEIDQPEMLKIVPAGPSVGERPVTDSTVQVVERYSVGVDEVGILSPHALALRVVDTQDGVGNGTREKKAVVVSILILSNVIHRLPVGVQYSLWPVYTDVGEHHD